MVKRKQTVKFFFQKNKSSRYQRKVYMALILSDAVLFSEYDPDYLKKIDALVGDHGNIKRFGQRRWMQRNAFLYRGYLRYLDPALERVRKIIPIKIQNLDLPSHEKLVSLHDPIGQDKLCLFINELKAPSKQFVGPLRIAFQTKDPEKIQCFFEACKKETAKSALFDVWPNGPRASETVIAKAYKRNISNLQERMHEEGWFMGFEVLSEKSFEDRLLSYAVFNK